MRLYHRSPAARVIRQRGFRTGPAVEFTTGLTPLRTEVLAHLNETALVFDVADDVVAPFEEPAGSDDYRVFRIPPEIANTFFPIVDQLSPERIRRTA
jgi:hypothetical protein